MIFFQKQHTILIFILCELRVTAYHKTYNYWKKLTCHPFTHFVLFWDIDDFFVADTSKYLEYVNICLLTSDNKRQ